MNQRPIIEADDADLTQAAESAVWQAYASLHYALNDLSLTPISVLCLLTQASIRVLGEHGGRENAVAFLREVLDQYEALAVSGEASSSTMPMVARFSVSGMAVAWVYMSSVNA